MSWIDVGPQIRSFAMAFLFVFGLNVCSGIFSGSASSQVSAPFAPQLLEQGEYSEYWEQFLVFEDGTILSSQFLIANFPFSRHRGIMVSSLLLPDGERLVIKNGRSRKGWVFAPDGSAISIYQNVLAATDSGFRLKLHNTLAELELQVASVAQPWKAPRLHSQRSSGWLDFDLYAPQATAQGRWRPGPEIGADPLGPWQPLEGGRGMGLHLVLTAGLPDLMQSWLRVTALGSLDDPGFFLSNVTRPDGQHQNVLLLMRPGQENLEFTGLSVEILETQRIEDADLPKLLRLKAQNGAYGLEGTIRLDRFLEYFNFLDHLNSIERILATSMPPVRRLRFLATYEMVLTGPGTPFALSGKAFGEQTAVGTPDDKSRKRRRRR